MEGKRNLAILHECRTRIMCCLSEIEYKKNTCKYSAPDPFLITLFLVLFYVGNLTHINTISLGNCPTYTKFNQEMKVGQKSSGNFHPAVNVISKSSELFIFPRKVKLVD